MATTPLAIGFRLYSAEMPLLGDGEAGKLTLVFRADTPSGIFERRHQADFNQGDDLGGLISDEMAAFQAEVVTAGFAVS